MIQISFCSRAAAPLERDAREVIGMRSIFTTLAIAAAVVSALAISPPTLARSGSGAGAPVGASSSAGSGGPSHSATRGSNATGPDAHRVSGAGSSPQFNKSSSGQAWHHGSTPPGWTGHGEKRGWDGGRMPPGLSRHDHDHDHDLRSHHGRSNWGDERGDHERAQFHTGQLEQHWGR